MSDKFEIWKNVTKGMRYVNVRDENNKVHSELVRPGGILNIKPIDREMHSNEVATDGLDMFKNGTFLPVTLVDEESAASIESNPNHLSESEVAELFDLKIADFRKKIETITSVYVLDNMLDLAKSEDEKVKATVKQLEALEARYEEVRPPRPTRITPVDQRPPGNIL